MLSIGARAHTTRDDVDARLGMGAIPPQGILANPRVRQGFFKASLVSTRLRFFVLRLR